jgi:hypothetical protein
MGEVNSTVGLAFTVCPSGQYSLNPSDKVCKTCLTYASCYGGSSISLDQGYWRSDNQSENIIECKGGAQRCNGGLDSSCTEPFSGPVCLQCNTAFGYIASGSNNCEQCSSLEELIWIGVIELLISIIYQIYIVYTTLKDNKNSFLEIQKSEEPKLKPGAYATILTTYTQMCTIFSKLLTSGLVISRLF